MSIRVCLLCHRGVWLSDLTFIEDGNPDKVEDEINFEKPRLVYKVRVMRMRLFVVAWH